MSLQQDIDTFLQRLPTESDNALLSLIPFKNGTDTQPHLPDAMFSLIKSLANAYPDKDAFVRPIGTIYGDFLAVYLHPCENGRKNLCQAIEAQGRSLETLADYYTGIETVLTDQQRQQHIQRMSATTDIGMAAVFILNSDAVKSTGDVTPLINQAAPGILRPQGLQPEPVTFFLGDKSWAVPRPQKFTPSKLKPPQR